MRIKVDSDTHETTSSADAADPRLFPSIDMNDKIPKVSLSPLPQGLDTLLIETVRRQYTLEWEGLHGASHWARVLLNGMELCNRTPEIRRDVVAQFAVLHDACRHDDDIDGNHGLRASSFVLKLHRAGTLALDAEGLALLATACATHTGGRIPADPTVMACWDSDRLDLARIGGVETRPEWLGTPAARLPEVLAAATARAKAREFPWREFFSG